MCKDTPNPRRAHCPNVSANTHRAADAHPAAHAEATVHATRPSTNAQQETQCAKVDAKLKLGQTLKALLRTNKLADITVTQVARNAGVTRQAFYYHFTDVNDAAAWVFETEIADHILRNASYSQWATGFEELLSYMHAHKPQVSSILRTLSLERTERFLFKALRVMMAAVVDELDTENALNDEDRTFLIDHYTLAIVGHLLHWLSIDMRDDPHELVENIEFIMHGHVTESIARMTARANRRRGA